MASLEGYIVLTIGNRLEVHQWTGSTLQRTAFFDAPILISSLNVVKTFILFGDVHKGIYFVQYRDQVRKRLAVVQIPFLQLLRPVLAAYILLHDVSKKLLITSAYGMCLMTDKHVARQLLLLLASQLSAANVRTRLGA